jgi:4-hydroxybenzoate polyprenyltransferase
MNDPPKIRLDYSSPAQETKREAQKEDDRRAGIEDYNVSTFGEKRPFTSGFLGLILLVALAWPAAIFLPRRVADLVMLIAVALWLGVQWMRRN